MDFYRFGILIEEIRSVSSFIVIVYFSFLKKEFIMKLSFENGQLSVILVTSACD